MELTKLEIIEILTNPKTNGSIYKSVLQLEC